MINQKRQNTTDSNHDDVWVFVCENQSPFRMVCEILRKEPNGMSLDEFQYELEQSLGWPKGSLNNFCVLDFLKRWRVVDIYRRKNETRVRFHSANNDNEQPAVVQLADLSAPMTIHELHREMQKAGHSTNNINQKNKKYNLTFNSVLEAVQASEYLQQFGKATVLTRQEDGRLRKSHQNMALFLRVYDLLHLCGGQMLLGELETAYYQKYGKQLTEGHGRHFNCF